MFLLSNVTAVIYEIIFIACGGTISNYFWPGVSSFCLAIDWGLLNIAHWNFSYEYYNMVRIIPFVLDDIPPP